MNYVILDKKLFILPALLFDASFQIYSNFQIREKVIMLRRFCCAYCVSIFVSDALEDNREIFKQHKASLLNNSSLFFLNRSYAIS